MKWVKIASRKQSLIEAYGKIIGWGKGISCGKIRLFFESKDGVLTFYFNDKDLLILKNRLNVILCNKKKESVLWENGINSFKDIINYTEKFMNMDLSKKTYSELIDYYKKFVELQIKIDPFIVLPTFVDDILIPKIEKILLKRKLSFDELKILASMRKESYVSKEEKELLRIALRNQNNIKEHVKKYCWIPIQAEEKPWDEKHFLDLIKNIKKNRDKYEKRLKFLENYVKNIKQKKKEVINKIKPNKKEFYLINLLEKWVYLKDYRREMISKYRYYSRNLFDEIGKRLDLKGLEVRNLLLKEVEERKIDRELIKQRMKYYVLTNHKENINVKLHKHKQTNVIKGYCVNPGKAKGVVKLVSGVSDKIKEGDILVTTMTTPDIVPMMKKAAAVITDEGGVFCHAAIISREFDIPCIVGTKIATEVLKNGDKVEIDADKDIVRKI